MPRAKRRYKRQQKNWKFSVLRLSKSLMEELDAALMISLPLSSDLSALTMRLLAFILVSIVVLLLDQVLYDKS